MKMEKEEEEESEDNTGHLLTVVGRILRLFFSDEEDSKWGGISNYGNDINGKRVGG